VRATSIRTIDGELQCTGLDNWFQAMSPIQLAEIWSCLGPWIDEVRPVFGPDPAGSFEAARTLDRGRVAAAVQRRFNYSRRLAAFLEPDAVLCIPTTPTLPPPRGFALGKREDKELYYFRTICLTCLAGVARLPQVSLPLADVDGIPVGLSFLAGHGQDAFLLGVVAEVARWG